MNLFDTRPEILADQSNPQELMAQLRALEHLDGKQQATLDYVLTDWVMIMLSRPADIEGVVELFQLCRLAQRCLDTSSNAETLRVRWVGFGDLLDARSLAIRGRSSPQSMVLRQEPAILAHLQQNKEVTQSDLTQILQLSAGRVSQVLAVLESRGQITRVRRGKESWVSLLKNDKPALPEQKKQSSGYAQSFFAAANDRWAA